MKKGKQTLEKRSYLFKRNKREQALRVNWINKMIDKQDCSAKCRMCDERDETVAQIVSECSHLAQNDYKKCRHDKNAAIIH